MKEITSPLPALLMGPCGSMLMSLWCQENSLQHSQTREFDIYHNPIREMPHLAKGSGQD